MPLKVSDGMGSWIKDFRASDAPQFAGKSAKDRRDMAIAAYLSKKNEETQVDEISKDLAGKYIKKRADDLPHAGYMMNDPHSSERRKKGVRDYVKMQKGIKTAVNKLTGKAMVPAKEAYMSGHGHGSGVVYGGKHDDPAFQALMKKHGVTHKLIGKSGKSAKLIGSPDNIRKVLQSEDKTTDAERAAIDAFMKKKGAKQLPPGKAQGHTGKSFSIKPMGISPDKMGLKGRGKHLDKDLVHKEDKAYGPTGIAYSVPKGHPDAVDPKTGKKKYPPHLTLDKMRAAFAPTKGGKDVKKEQGPTGKPSRITRADVDQAKRDLTVAQIRKKISNLRNEQTSGPFQSKKPGPGMHRNSMKTRIKPSNASPPAPNPKVSDPALKQRIAKKKKDFLDKNPTRRKTTPDAIRHDRLAAAQAKDDAAKTQADAAKAEKQKSPGKISRFASWSKDKVKKYGPAATVAGGLAHAIGSV